MAFHGIGQSGEAVASQPPDGVLKALRTARRTLAALLVPVLAGLVLAASPATAQRESSQRLVEQAPDAGTPGLAPARETSHAVALPDRTLRITATAGALAVANDQRTVLADFAYTAYTLEGSDPLQRPVVFAFNGGPGAASTWLQLGAIGPWRVALTAATITSQGTPDLLANAETWLDFADLVFLDPPGTGYSTIWTGARGEPPAAGIYLDPVLPTPPRDRRARSQQGRTPAARNTGGPDWFWSLEGDATTFSEVIAAWLDRNGRRGSPVVLVGESYGGFRAPLVAEQLASAHDVSVAAMILASPVLDFDGRRSWRPPQHYAAILPSIAATVRELEGVTPSRAAMADVEAYAYGDLVRDLMRGPRDEVAVARVSERVADFSRVSESAVRGLAGRLSAHAFIQNSPQLVDRIVSIYDAAMGDLPGARGNRRGGFGDPFTSGLGTPLAGAMAVLHERLQWRPERRYQALSGEVNRRWRWANVPQALEVVGTIDQLHRQQPRMRTLVVHGFTDLVTPYFASVMQLDQLPAHGPDQRITMEVYPGGHMFYNRDVSRARFRADAERIIAEALGSTRTKPVGDQRETP